MSDSLKKAIELKFDLNLWPTDFVKGCALIAAKNRLNVDSVILAFVLGTSIFAGKSEITVDGSDRVEVGSLWILNIQVSLFLISSVKLICPIQSLINFCHITIFTVLMIRCFCVIWDF